MTDKSPKHKSGPKPLDPKNKRTHTVSVRMNEAELAHLDALRAPRKLQRGAYMRSAFAQSLPPAVPELNREAWLDLSKSAANLNQIAKHLNQGKPVGVGLILDAVAKFRCSLIKAELKNES